MNRKRPAFSGGSKPQLTSTELGCTAEVETGRFCDRPSMALAPFPICTKHAAEVYNFIRDVFSGPPGEPSPEPEPLVGTIYYLRVGDLIKIGFTVNLTGRLQAYPPNSVLLATEMGTPQGERSRHRQFDSALAYGKEWFTPTPELLAHIEQVAQN